MTYLFISANVLKHRNIRILLERSVALIFKFQRRLESESVYYRAGCGVKN